MVCRLGGNLSKGAGSGGIFTSQLVEIAISKAIDPFPFSHTPRGSDNRLIAAIINLGIKDGTKGLEANRTIEPECALKNHLAIIFTATCDGDSGRSRDGRGFSLTEEHCLSVKGFHARCGDKIAGNVATLIEKCDGASLRRLSERWDNLSSNHRSCTSWDRAEIRVKRCHFVENPC